MPRRYIEFARLRVAPRLSEGAATALQSEYIKFRKQVLGGATADGEDGAGKAKVSVPITVRQLEALVRISEAMAKMQLSHVVTEEHVKHAVELFTVSTMDAANSGVLAAASNNPEDIAELRMVEDEIKKRVAMQATTSVTKLKDELRRVGIADALSSRALLIMEQQGVVRLGKERRSVKRVAA